jgi:hypothetical protein
LLDFPELDGFVLQTAQTLYINEQLQELSFVVRDVHLS